MIAAILIVLAFASLALLRALARIRDLGGGD